MTEYRPDIEFAAKQHGLDADLVEAVVLTESSGRADAFRFEPTYYARYLQGKPEYAGQIARRISSSYGLMQVMYPTAQQYGFKHEPEMLFLPGVGLDYGCRHLSAMVRRFGFDVRKALQAYNGGPGNVGAPATVTYAIRVLRALEGLTASAHQA